jgi:hypothetical protein
MHMDMLNQRRTNSLSRMLPKEYEKSKETKDASTAIIHVSMRLLIRNTLPQEKPTLVLSKQIDELCLLFSQAQIGQVLILA